jgi:uncharacterized membrane protein YphA (DoxX/SURF4 family)
MIGLGRRVYGLAAIALGLIGLVWDDFALVWQPVPAGLPGRAMLAYAVAAALVLAGAALNLKRSEAFGAAVLTILYALCVLLLHAPRAAAHPMVVAVWGGIAEQLALTAGGLVAFAASARIGAPSAARLSRVGILAFGVCLVVFGLMHFFYVGPTAAMVPKWLPAGQAFWAYATGAAHIAAGLAILSGVLARLASVLVTAMFVGFGVLVHAPLLLADAASHLNWTSNAINLALVGAAWVVADALAKRG